MIKKIICIFAILFFVIFSKDVFASGFNLKSIGGLNTDGRQISHWWYAGTNVPMTGEASPDSTVTVSIDDESNTVTADGSGDWSYNPGALTEGDHKIVLENNESKISFTLTLGKENVDWDAVGKDSGGETLPTVGVVTPTIMLLALSTMMFLGGKKLLKRN